MNGDRLWGEMAGEGATTTGLAGDLQIGPVVFEHMPHDGKPQSGTAGRAGATGVDPVEALGQTRDMSSCDTGAGVLDRQCTTALINLPSYLDVSLGRCVANRVKHQVGNRAV